MMQHPGIRNIVAAALAYLVVGSGFARAQTGPSNVARVSFVQGSVQLLAGRGTDFQPAVINLPVLDGSRVQTGADGQAEIEFADGSVARLTPNSGMAFPHLGQDQAQIQQVSGLAYYEFNVGDGHPLFSVQFGNETVQPATNSILRVGLDAGWDVAVISGSVQVQGEGIPGVAVAENQSIRSGADNSGAPYVVTQGIDGDSWDNWNQDRDQAIAQEASQQTPVRDDTGNPQNENWNDLDADGNWYPVEGAGNVWVPGGVGPGWDPYGAGYWAYYPTYGYTWVSSYPWGWLPYHCGAWNYYSFGWGWAPGGCGGWSPVVIVGGHPPGWTMPIRPRPPGGIHPVGGLRLVAVDRGPVATGPWSLNSGFRPAVNHQQALNFNGQTVAPVEKIAVRQGFVGVRGTAPGSRAVLNGGAPAVQRQSPASSYVWGANPPRAVESPNGRAVQPSVGYPAVQAPAENQRSTYVSRPMPTAHYSAPPPAHYSAPPPAPHASSPGPRR
jgi:hypothetical protein